MLNQTEINCLNACQACMVACLQCAAACLKEDNNSAMMQCILHDLECADICQLAIAAMARGDMHIKDICILCEKACTGCGAECAKHTMDHCQHCAETCKQCVIACKSMVASMNESTAH